MIASWFHSKNPHELIRNIIAFFLATHFAATSHQASRKRPRCLPIRRPNKATMAECANPLFLSWIKEWLDDARQQNSKGVSMFAQFVLTLFKSRTNE